VYYTETYYGEPLPPGGQWHGGWDESQHIPAKWIAPDGGSFYLLCSCSDTFGVIKATLATPAP
jgi:hypothetical protein